MAINSIAVFKCVQTEFNFFIISVKYVMAYFGALWQTWNLKNKTHINIYSFGTFG